MVNKFILPTAGLPNQGKKAQCEILALYKEELVQRRGVLSVSC